MISRRTYVPVLLPFPVWRWGPICDRIDGTFIRDGWWPDRFAKVEVPQGTTPSEFLSCLQA